MLRLGLFCIYLCLIVGLVFLETFQPPFSIKQGFQWNGLNSIWGINNIVPCLCLVISGCALYTIRVLKYKQNNRACCKPKHIENIAPWNYDYVPTFVTLLAIVSFNYEGIRGLFLFIGIMLIIFAIFARTSMFYSSPLYRILGLKIYQVDDSLLGDHCILMSFDDLSDKEVLFCRKIYENVYYVTRS